MPDIGQFQEDFRRIESLLEDLERVADRATSALARDLVSALLSVHGIGLGRLLELIAASGEAGKRLLAQAAGDECVQPLLLLHGLHPTDLETRVLQALEKVRPYTHSHGGNVELIALEGGRVRLRLEGSCHGCPSSQATLRDTIEKAIYELAPDVNGIEVEGLVEAGHNGDGVQAAETSRFALPVLRA